MRAREQDLRNRYDRLIPHEREVFLHLIGGPLNKQVASDLQITERTIKMHRANIFQKLEVDSMSEFVRLAELLDAGNRRSSIVAGGCCAKYVRNRSRDNRRSMSTAPRRDETAT